MAGQVESPGIAERTAEHLQSLILEGVLTPGARLAPEREMAERLGVSRPSLRAALALLETRGLVKTGRDGTVIAELIDPLALPLARMLGADERGAADYFEYRLMLEPQAAALAAVRATEPDRADLSACLRGMQEAFEARSSAVEAEADARLHLLVHTASHNLILIHTMTVFARLLRNGILTSREQLFRDDRLRADLMVQHAAVVDAILEGDAPRAEATMRQHIAFTAEHYVAMRAQGARLLASERRAQGRAILAG